MVESEPIVQISAFLGQTFHYFHYISEVFCRKKTRINFRDRRKLNFNFTTTWTLPLNHHTVNLSHLSLWNSPWPSAGGTKIIRKLIHLGALDSSSYLFIDKRQCNKLAFLERLMNKYLYLTWEPLKYVVFLQKITDRPKFSQSHSSVRSVARWIGFSMEKNAYKNQRYFIVRFCPFQNNAKGTDISILFSAELSLRSITF